MMEESYEPIIVAGDEVHVPYGVNSKKELKQASLHMILLFF